MMLFLGTFLTVALVTAGGSRSPECGSAAACPNSISTVDGGDEDLAMVQLRRPHTEPGMPLSGLHSTARYAQNETEEKTCAIVKYAAKYALPANAAADGFEAPMTVGSEDNMDPKLRDLGIDFTGIWWMRGNPVPEELASFAHATTNSSSFPATISVPNNRNGAWSWVNNAIGQMLVGYYSIFDPLEPIEFDFSDNTSGSIFTALKDLPLVWVEDFPFIYLNEDEWLRPSIFQDGSLIPDTNYTLTRVVMGDGSPHPTYWPLFLEHMTSETWFGQGVAGEKEMISFSSNDACMRKCQVALPCFMCQRIC